MKWHRKNCSINFTYIQTHLMLVLIIAPQNHKQIFSYPSPSCHETCSALTWQKSLQVIVNQWNQHPHSRPRWDSSKTKFFWNSDSFRFPKRFCKWVGKHIKFWTVFEFDKDLIDHLSDPLILYFNVFCLSIKYWPRREVYHTHVIT